MWITFISLLLITSTHLAWSWTALSLEDRVTKSRACSRLLSRCLRNDLNWAPQTFSSPSVRTSSSTRPARSRGGCPPFCNNELLSNVRFITDCLQIPAPAPNGQFSAGPSQISPGPSGPGSALIPILVSILFPLLAKPYYPPYQQYEYVQWWSLIKLFWAGATCNISCCGKKISIFIKTAK